MIKIGDVVSLIDMNQLDILEQLQCEKDFKMTNHAHSALPFTCETF